MDKVVQTTADVQICLCSGFSGVLNLALLIYDSTTESNIYLIYQRKIEREYETTENDLTNEWSVMFLIENESSYM